MNQHPSTRPRGRTLLPRWAERLLRLVIPAYHRDIVIGDFAELYRAIAASQGRGRALWWYWGQVLKSTPAFVSTSVYSGGDMLKNYLTIAFRNLRRHKGYAFLNISGLALGIACCLLILLYVQDERAYDRFYEQADQIYRVAIQEVTPTSDALYPMTPYPLAATLVQDYPEVVHATRVGQRRAFAVVYEDQSFNETRIHRADSNFFEIFALPFVAGDPKTALKEPSSVVITASIAKKYFGEDDPMGKVLDVKDGITSSTPFTVTGVVEDLPAQTHFHFDLLTTFFRAGRPRRNPQSWFGYGVYTYLLLDQQQPPEALEAKFPEMLQRYGGPQFEEDRGISLDDHLAAGNAYHYFMQPLPEIHLRSNMGWEIEPNGNITYVYLFTAIAFFILLIACVNYMNLATARSAGRAREIGVRKVMGSHRRQLIAQILIESVLMTGLAFVAALVLVEAVKPAFNAFTGKALEVGYFSTGIVVPALLGSVLVIGILAGSYPAFFLSAFRPVVVLKGAGSAGPSRTGLRNGLVVFQFVISIALLVGTFVIQGQMDFMLNKKLGFDKEHVVVIEKAWALGDQSNVFKQEVLKHTSVVSVAMADAVPGNLIAELFMAPDTAARSVQHNVLVMEADHDYVQTLGLEMAQGRPFDVAMVTDSMAVVVNEALVEVMGLKGNPIGQHIRFASDETAYPIIGVIKDFHFKSLHDQIEPYAVFIEDDVTARSAIRIRSDDVPGTLAYLEETWEAFVPDRPFVYSFLEQDLAALYRAEEQTRTIFGGFSLLAIVIACLGLFGLSAFIAEQRTKEIGVRKVLGATMGGIVLLLSKDFLKLVGLAFVVAAPVAYLVMDRWLQGFAYHVEISWQMFLIAGLTALVIAMLTVSYQSIRAARVNPVEALRYE